MKLCTVDTTRDTIGARLRLWRRRGELHVLFGLAKIDQVSWFRFFRVCSAYCPNEFRVMLDHCTRLQINQVFKNAWIRGGMVMSDGDEDMLVYLGSEVGRGGLAHVHDIACVTSDGELICEVAKVSRLCDAAGAQLSDAQLELLAVTQRIEMQNACRLRRAHSPYLAPLLFTLRKKDTSSQKLIDEQLLLIYRKIVGPRGRVVSLENYIRDPQVPLSGKVHALSFLFDGTHAAHSVGVALIDIKPNNAVLNWKGEGVLVDFASALKFDQAVYFNDAKACVDNQTKMTVMVNDGERAFPYSLVVTPEYCNPTLFHASYQRKGDLREADFYALGVSIIHLLMDCNILEPVTVSGPEQKFSIEAVLDPASLLVVYRLMEIAQVLMNIVERVTLCDLQKYAIEIRNLASILRAIRTTQTAR